MYIFQLVDWFIAALSVITIGILECVIISWVYGVDHFGQDIKMMIGRTPPFLIKILWCFITPFLLLVS